MITDTELWGGGGVGGWRVMGREEDEWKGRRVEGKRVLVSRSVMVMYVLGVDRSHDTPLHSRVRGCLSVL